ncbi:hypothetical protein MAPG_01879, partial [Magnaporthiopsis poae ATCC 64411]
IDDTALDRRSFLILWILWDGLSVAMKKRLHSLTPHYLCANLHASALSSATVPSQPDCRNTIVTPTRKTARENKRGVSTGVEKESIEVATNLTTARCSLSSANRGRQLAMGGRQSSFRGPLSLPRSPSWHAHYKDATSRPMGPHETSIKKRIRLAEQRPLRRAFQQSMDVTRRHRSLLRLSPRKAGWSYARPPPAPVPASAFFPHSTFPGFPCFPCLQTGRP